jgi:cytochrome c553
LIASADRTAAGKIIARHRGGELRAPADRRAIGKIIARHRGDELIAMVVSLFLLAAIGCHQQLTPGKPLSELTPQETAGRQVFVSQCSRCHYADAEKGLNGPGLEGLLRKPYLPSGQAANDARVSAVILHGRNMMPALGNTLSDEQLQDLMAYLHTL